MALRFRALLAVVAPLAAGCFIDATSELDTSSSGGSPSDGAAGPGGGANGGGGASNGGSAQGGDGGTPMEGGGGSTATGMGGGMCGNEQVEPGEACDDEGDTDPFDGCDGCEHGPRATCAEAEPIDLQTGRTISISATTVDSGDDFNHGMISGLGCASDGPDAWVAVRAASAGSVTITLQAAEEGDWGGTNEKAVLIVRDGCAFDDPGEVRVCRETSTLPGVTTTQMIVTEGQVLLIGVDGRGNGEQGPFDLQIAHHRCGDSMVQAPEQCDFGEATTSCVGCLLVGGTDPCGTDDGDTESFYLATTSHCYVYDWSEDRTFYAAREACIEIGGDLASLTPVAEKAAFEVVRKLDVLSWIGVEDFNHDEAFRWLEGGAFDALWDQGSPNNGESEPICGQMIAVETVGNVFRDATCDATEPGFVCELPGVE